MALDLEFIRNQFPAFGEQPLRSLVYLDNAHTTFASRHTLWRLNRFNRERSFDHRMPLHLPGVGTDEILTSRRALAQSLNVQEDEVYFGPSVGAIAHAVVSALAERFHPGDEIIIADQCHPTLAAQARDLAKHGLVVRHWSSEAGTGHLTLESLTNMLDGRVRLVLMPHVAPFLGTEHDLAGICRLLHSHHAMLMVDGSSRIGLGFPNLGTTPVDVYVGALNKVFGPRLGIVVLRPGVGGLFPPLHGDIQLDWLNRPVPFTVDPGHAAAAGGVTDYFDAVYAAHFSGGRDAKGRMAETRGLFVTHVSQLRSKLVTWITGCRGLRLLTADAAQGPTLGILPNRPAAHLAQALEQRGVVVGFGRYGFGGFLTQLGVPGHADVLRIGLQHYTSEADIDRLIDGLRCEGEV